MKGFKMVIVIHFAIPIALMLGDSLSQYRLCGCYLVHANTLRWSHACAVSQWKSKLCHQFLQQNFFVYVNILARYIQEVVECLTEKLVRAYASFDAPYPLSEIQRKENCPRFARNHCWCYTEYRRDGIIIGTSKL